MDPHHATCNTVMKQDGNKTKTLMTSMPEGSKGYLTQELNRQAHQYSK